MLVVGVEKDKDMLKSISSPPQVLTHNYFFNFQDLKETLKSLAECNTEKGILAL